MNEAEWLSSEDPAAMLGWLTATKAYDPPGRQPSNRKFFMFCRAVLGPQCDHAPEDCTPGGMPLAQWVRNCTATPTQAQSVRVEQAALLREIVGNPWKPVTLPMVKRLTPPPLALRR